MQSRYKNYQQIYTDGSKEDSKVCCDVISDIALDSLALVMLTINLLYFLTRFLY